MQTKNSVKALLMVVIFSYNPFAISSLSINQLAGTPGRCSGGITLNS